MTNRPRHKSRLSSPDQHLRRLQAQYPRLHEMVLTILDGKGKDLPDWPDYCLIPISGWIAIATGGEEPTDPSYLTEALRLAAIGTWSYSRGIYQLDPDLTQELIQTPLTDSIPSEVLTRLPEWCLYVEAPLTYQGSPINGFWVWLEYDQQRRHTELRFLIDEGADFVYSFMLHLGNFSIQTAMKKVLEEAAKNVPGYEPENEKAILDYMTGAVAPLLSIVLYLCSEKPDIDPHPEPDPRTLQIHDRSEPGRVLVPAQKTRLFKAGQKIGAAIRRSNSAPTSDGAKKRAHLRRGHWHGYWYGARANPDQRRFSYRWLHPILVGTAPDDPLSPNPPAD